ncbi:uncharacterized protein LOC132197419 [Neocloeon triangulifer]|uniref:uncharacterized protein LOC132197419 n=1 Tax=Neocloeon triangulifer TaxID=2078957 RepID=UPI00286F02B2|nr:uncharacterized protein LOC132197419 [Neocloeon triangulifer]XP_059476685.1 uncharacterized protein LOC132197419 [Neocloeon triangulifer]XP_059476686.1 uncharacterized protein LOC132197419 [Neocloeon triangulifer]XP_059476687.1 uncharacterized protein LOC132197419 [Neocloeon triangulifer]
MEKNNQSRDEGCEAPPEAKIPRRSTRSQPGDLGSHRTGIHRAIMNVDFPTIEKLLSEGETFCTEEGLNCFTLAACNPTSPVATSWELVCKMLNKDLQAGLSARSADGSTLLMIFSKYVKKIEFLVNLGANVNDVDNNGNTVLMRSFMHTYPKSQAFLKLLELGANPNVPVGNKHPNIISFMFSKLVKNFEFSPESPNCFKYIMQPKYFGKIEKSQFEKTNPIFDYIDMCFNMKGRISDEINNVLKDENFPKFNMPILSKGSWRSRRGSSRDNEWIILKQALIIPNEFLLDPLSYYLLKIDLWRWGRLAHNTVQDMKVQVGVFRDLGCVAENNKNILPPSLALVYNAIQSCEFQTNNHNNYNGNLRSLSAILCEFCIEDETLRLSGSWFQVVTLLGPFLAFMPHSLDMSKFAQYIMTEIPENPFDVITQMMINMRLMFSRSQSKSNFYIQNFCSRPLLLILKTFLGPNCTLPWDKLLHKKFDEKILTQTLELLQEKGITTKEIKKANVRGRIQTLETLSLWCVRRRLSECRNEGQKLHGLISKLVESTPLPKNLQNKLQLFN